MSCGSAIPSPSESGHPLNFLGPASFGHASFPSSIPSPSESGHPLNLAKPATSKSEENSPAAIAQRVTGILTYSTNHPYGEFKLVSYDQYSLGENKTFH